MKKLSILIMVFLLTGVVSAQFPHGSNSIIHTQSARTFDKGRLEIYSGMNFYTKLADYIGDPSLRPENFNANNMWLVAGNLALTYGITNHFDVTLAPRIYQDTHYANEFNLPGYIFMRMKAGSFAFAQRKMHGAMMLAFRFPTGEQHNYPHAEYASGSVEYGFSGALSYFADPYLPERAFSTHLNVGWWNHNEAGEKVYGERTATKNSSKLHYALGFVYPTGLFDYRLELNGINFIEQPDTMVYSREDWIYLTPSIRYKALEWLSLDLGVDVRLSSDSDESKGIPQRSRFDLPNYATWKVFMGLNLTVLPLTSVSRSTAEVERDEFNKRVEFFQNIIEERQRTEDIQEELDRLKQEREAAERELEELKQILEEEGS
jgi:hypothetical protein